MHKKLHIKSILRDCHRHHTAATVTHNDAVFLWKQKPARKTPCTGLFPYRICRNVKRGAFVQTKMATNNWNKKLFSAEWEQWQEVLAVAQRVRGGRSTATHSPRAAGSHFLPGAPPEWPVVTPEGLGEEVTIGRFDWAGNKVIRLWSRNSLLIAFVFPARVPHRWSHGVVRKDIFKVYFNALESILLRGCQANLQLQDRRC